MEQQLEFIALDGQRLSLMGVSSRPLGELTLTVLANCMTDQLLWRLDSYLWGASKVAYHKYPADWWQAVKARWFPARLLQRWPVRYTVIKCEAKEILPDLVMPKSRRPRCYVATIARQECHYDE